MRRTLLYVPGNNPGMLRDAGIYPADCLLFDLEDSVSVLEKDAARMLVREALVSMEYPGKEVFVRVNALATPWGLEDLNAIVSAGKAGIRLPKAETAQDVVDCEREIERLEKQCGLPAGSTRMMAAVESAAGVLNAREIAASSTRLVAIAIGAEDYVTDLKTTRSAEGIELLFGRSMVLLAARAAGIDAIDTVFANVNDEEGLRRETALIKQLGFDGKSIINPRQIGAVHEVFAPTDDEITKAKKILEISKEAERGGFGVVSMNGKMIDRPVVLRALRTLELAVGRRRGHAL